MTEKFRRNSEAPNGSVYPREDARTLLTEIATYYLSGPATIEAVEWDDGDYRLTAFHSIRTSSTRTEAFEEATGDDGLPFYREQVVYSTPDDRHGTAPHVALQVVRRWTGRTREEVVYEREVAFLGPDDERTADAAGSLVDSGVSFHGRGGPSPPAPAPQLDANGDPVGRVESLSLTIDVNQNLSEDERRGLERAAQESGADNQREP